MSFIEKLTAFRRQRTETEIETWRRLLKTAVADEALAVADLSRLDELHVKYGTGDLSAAVADIQAHAEQVKIAGGLAKADSAIKNSEAKVAAHRAETARIEGEYREVMKVRQEQEEALTEQIQQARIARMEPQRAADTAATLQARQWRFFNHRDPAEMAAEVDRDRARRANVRYLSHSWGDEASAPGVVQFEGFLHSNQQESDDPNNFTWECLPGQSLEDLLYYVNLLKQQFRKRRIPYSYLVKPGVRPLASYVRGEMLNAFDETLAAAKSGWNPDNRVWIRYPGQTQIELDEMVNQLTIAFAEHERGSASRAGAIAPALGR